MFESLSEKLQAVFDRLGRKGRLSEEDVELALREVRVALLEALQCAVALKAKALHVYSDSEVVVRQMRGQYACRSSRLYSLHWICCKLTRSLKFSITHVPRERNMEANGLANSAVRQQISSKTAGVRLSCTL